MLVLTLRIFHLLVFKLFIISSHTYKNLLMIIILIMQWSLLAALISHKVKLPLQHNFNRATEIFSNSIMLIVIMVNTVDKVALLFNLITNFSFCPHLQQNATQVAQVLKRSTQIQSYCWWWQRCSYDICLSLF